MRLEFPQEWRILLVLDDGLKGAHGAAEVDAFGKLGGFSARLTQQLQKILLDNVIPLAAKARHRLLWKWNHPYSKSGWRLF